MLLLRSVVVCQLLLRSFGGFATPTTSSSMERRIDRIARLVGPSPFDGESSALVQIEEEYKKPAGSRIVLSETDAGTLVVSVPGRRLGAADAGQATFAAAWISIVGAWTASAAAASPFFALFSTPFWFAGVRMARDLVPVSTTIVVGKYAWELTTEGPLGRTKTISAGATRDLDRAEVEVEAYVNDSPVTSLRLVEGVNEYAVRGLAPIEQKWLADLLNAWLKRIDEEDDDQLPPANNLISSS